MVLSTCMGVGVWGFPSSSRVVRIVRASLAFIKEALISDFAAEDITFLMIWHRVWMALLLVGRVGGCSDYRRVGSKVKNGLWIDYVRVLHRDRAHHWQRGE